MLKLLSEYKKSENERIIKSLVLFVGDEDDLEMIDKLISDDILFKILNFDIICLMKLKR